MTRALTIVAVALLGGVIGALVTAWLAPAAQQPAPASPDLGTLEARLDALSRGNARAAARLTSLEAEGPKPQERAREATSELAAPGPEEIPPRRQTPEEQRQEQETLLAEHAAEAVDKAWAADTGGELDRALNQLERPGEMEITSVECRSRTCLARLQWPSILEAYEVRRSVLALPTDLPCERRLYLGEDGANAEGYEGTLLLTCSR